MCLSHKIINCVNHKHYLHRPAITACRTAVIREAEMRKKSKKEFKKLGDISMKHTS